MQTIAQFKTQYGHIYSIKGDGESFLIDILDKNESEIYPLHKIDRVGKSNTYAFLNVSDAMQSDVQSITTTMFRGDRSHFHTAHGGAYVTKYFTDFIECLIQACEYEVTNEWDYPHGEVQFVRVG